MRLERYILGLLAALTLTLGGGCQKSASDSTANQKSPVLARVHWVGKNHLLTETNAARFMSLWNLPASARLETQTLDKLALAMTGEPPLLVTNQISVTLPITNAATSKPVVIPAQTIDYQLSTANHPLSTKLRPLLDDLVREEWYLEVQQQATQPAELALAVRLGAPRAGLWTSNLTALFGSLTNVQSLPSPANGLAWRLPGGLSAIGNRLFSPTSQGEKGGVRGSSSQGPTMQGNSRSPIVDSQSRAPTANSTQAPCRLDLVRAGDWMLVGLSRERNARLDDFAARIQRDQAPVSTDPSIQESNNPTIQQSNNPSLWLEADLDLPRLLAWARGGDGSSPNSSDQSSRHGDEPSPPLPTNFPRVFLTVQADNAGVRTRAKLDFPEPLPFEMEAWNIPTNLIHDPLIGFCAVRGIRPWLTNWTSAFSLQPSAFPNQAFFWAQNGSPDQHFLALPSADASNQVCRLSDLALRRVNPILATNGWPDSALVRHTNSPGLVLQGNPFFSPDLNYADFGGNRYLFGGLSRHMMSDSLAPAELFRYLASSPKLVAYDWENTRPCLGSWIQMAQLTRHMLCLPRMNGPDNAGLAWLLALEPRLANSVAVTSVELSSPTRLSFARSSATGFTGVELQVLADWLESLHFPRGLHTSTAPPPPPSTDMLPQTNAAAPLKANAPLGRH